MAKYIFITGGVVSSLGKGMSAATIGALLKARGFNVRIRKFDPYLNIDPGTMSPRQHGEVFVTDDGTETDLDLGHYERFLAQTMHKNDSISGGKVYKKVLKKERKGKYLGQTVQMIPNVTDQIKKFIKKKITDEDFVICEVGGTVGDIESLVFLEAIRQFANEIGRRNAMFVHLTLLPYIETVKELKTKPTQHSHKTLLATGIQADMLICRSKVAISDSERKKLAMFCNIEHQNILCASDVDNVYKLPLMYGVEGVDRQVLSYFGLSEASEKPNTLKWEELAKRIDNACGDTAKKVHIAIVEKYSDGSDAYKSLNDAIHHAAWEEGFNVSISWIKSELLEKAEDASSYFEGIDGVIVPGGFGERGAEGKIKAIRYVRENNIPYFGICFGMQLAVVEFARGVLGIKDASTTEFERPCTPVISLITEWQNGGEIIRRTEKSKKGGTLRLGSYTCRLMPHSLAYNIYKSTTVNERHRHRYEMNMDYEGDLAKAGLVVAGRCVESDLPEIVELKGHPFFIGVQFHPEFKSNPFNPHPIFRSFLKASVNSRLSSQNC